MTLNTKFEEFEVRTRGSVKYTYLYRPSVNGRVCSDDFASDDRRDCS